MISEEVHYRDKGRPLRVRPWLPFAYVAMHIGLDAASFVQPVLKLGITPISPQAGLAIAFLMSTRRSLGWAVVALILSELIVRGAPDQPLPLVVQAVGLACIYQLAARVGQRWSKAIEDSPLRQTLGFMAIAAVTAAAAALFSVGLFVVSDLLPEGRFLSAVSRFWVGDLNGILMLTPLLLRLKDFPLLGREIYQNKWSAISIAAALFVAFSLIFVVGNPDDLRFFYLLFLPAIAAALTWGITGILITAVLLQIGLIIGVQRLPEVAPLVDLQYLMSTLLVAGLALGAVVKERETSSQLALQREQLLRKAESNLARATRSAMAGELASTLAHELNQPMTALVGYLRAAEIMVSSGSSEDPRVGATLKKAANEALRATDILRRIRDFYAGKAPQIEPLRISDVVRSLTDTMRKAAGKNELTVQIDRDNADLIVTADRVFVEVILANLLLNAFDAGFLGRGTVLVGVKSALGRVVISVDDDGSGISTDVLPQLFRPFVTTKSDGMGVGLAVSRSLAEACGGELRAGKGVLGGARFELVLNQP